MSTANPAWVDTAQKGFSALGGALGGWFGLDGGNSKTSQQAHAQQFPEKTQPTPSSAPIGSNNSAPSLMSTQNMMLLAGAGVLLLILVKK